MGWPLPPDEFFIEIANNFTLNCLHTLTLISRDLQPKLLSTSEQIADKFQDRFIPLAEEIAVDFLTELLHLVGHVAQDFQIEVVRSLWLVMVDLRFWLLMGLGVLVLLEGLMVGLLWVIVRNIEGSVVVVERDGEKVGTGAVKELVNKAERELRGRPTSS